MALAIPPPPIGTRTAEVLVEHRVDSGGGGFPVDTWEPLRTLWMRKIDLIGNEAFRADQVSARYDVRFIGPYAPELDPELVDVPATHRLTYRGRIYDVVNAVVVGHFEGIEYRAITHTGGG
jgi:SPP1 family predicted phage head-tail adaptor